MRDTLARHGLKLVAQYGSSGYWIDYAVAHPTQPGRYVLALECDGASYHSSESARDRDRLRREQLERLGWRFHRIWSSEWFYNKDKAVSRVLEAYQEAVQAAASGENEADGSRTRLTSPSDTGDQLSLTTRGPRPPLGRRSSIDDYALADLMRLVQWIESDDLIRTRDELLTETIRELGFARRGKKIVAAVEAAIRATRH